MADETFHARLLAELEKPYEIWAPEPAARVLGAQRLALLAVVKLHAPRDTYVSGGPTGRPLCFGCDMEGYDAEHPDYPCSTIRTIAHELGITERTEDG